MNTAATTAPSQCPIIPLNIKGINNQNQASISRRWGPRVLLSLSLIAVGCFWTFTDQLFNVQVDVRRLPFLWSTLVDSRFNISSFTCQGEEMETRQCLFKNVLVKDGAIWLFLGQQGKSIPQVPPMLCSIVNKASPVQCDVHVVHDEEVWLQLVLLAAPTMFQYGAMVSRLNPHNAYHVLFEDMIPITGMIRKAFRLPEADGRSLFNHLSRNRWGLFISDRIGNDLLDATFWSALLPEIRLIYPSAVESHQVETLLAGSGVGCVHWGHCQPLDRPPGIFSPSDAALVFRDLVLRRLDLREAQGEQIAEEAKEMELAPRIVIVQRSTTRQIRNLPEVIEAAKQVIPGTAIKVVDMGELSVQEQVRQSHETDILIMVHGGALANVLWLPYRALLIDIYPYAFWHEIHSALIHWMRRALSPYELGHFPFQVDRTEGQELVESGPLKTNCSCQGDFNCQARTFWGTSLIQIDISRFRQHLQEGVEQWSLARKKKKEGEEEEDDSIHAYRAPLNPGEFNMSALGKRAEREEPAHPPHPLCYPSITA